MHDPVDPVIRSRAVAAARGLEPFDILLMGATVVDVGTGELRAADVGLVGPLIASVHAPGDRTDALDTVDLHGRYLAPGFIDMHVHFESSMLTPGAYAEAVCPRGTTTVFCDPHELANVCGVDGVRYTVEASRGLPVRFIVQAPSCVPPIPGLELSGADLHGDEVRQMLAWPEVGGLAEVMDMGGVLGRADRMVEVVAAGLASGKLISGHAAGLTGPDLQAYLCAGILSDHEIFVDGDVAERLRAGMTVELRGMIDALLPGAVEAIQALPQLPAHVVAATDDLFALTLLTDGGIDHLLRRLVVAGLDPVVAIRIATHHAALRLERSDLGLVAAGRRADLVVLSDLEAMTVDDVWTDGRHVASAGQMLAAVVEGPSNPPLDTMRLDRVTRDDFVLRLPGQPDGPVAVRTVAGAVVTEWGQTTVEVRSGVVHELPAGHVLQVAIHRHGRAPATPAAALLADYVDHTAGREWTGAVATTVAHDTHNLVVFGRDPDDMALAALTVIDAGGGIAVTEAGRVIAVIELPIAGLLSPRPAAEVAEAQRATQAAALRIGLHAPTLTQPLFQVLLSSLACLGGPHVTDVGLVDGTTGELVGSLLAEGGGG
jgi:adenine deaminase